RETGAGALDLSFAQSSVLYSILVLVAGVIIIVMIAGPQIRTRLGDTTSGGLALSDRVRVWSQTLLMVRDFPVFGVGLGCWPELFSHYQAPPSSPYLFFREVHNDYLELFADIGVVGFAVFLVWGIATVAALMATRSQVRRQDLPRYLALLTGLGALAVHEGFDFPLQIPAIAILGIILFASALRLGEGSGDFALKRFRAGFAVAAFVLFVLIAIASQQRGLPYPYNIPLPRSLAQAKLQLMQHP